MGQKPDWWYWGLVKYPIPKTSWTKRLLNSTSFVTMTQANKVTLKPSPSTSWPFWLIIRINLNLTQTYQLPMNLTPIQGNRWNFLRLRVILSRQVILTLKFGTVWLISSVIAQLTKTDWSGMATLWKPATFTISEWKVNMIPELLSTNLSLLPRQMWPTSSPSFLNLPTRLPPLLTAIMLSLRYLTSMIYWQRLLINLEITSLPYTWYLTHSMLLTNDSNVMDFSQPSLSFI